MPEKKPYKPADLSQVDVVEFLTGLGIGPLTFETEDNIRFSCPYPEHQFGDKTPSAYMKQGTTVWLCHACERSGNAITFLADVANVSRFQARQWITEKWSPLETEIEDLVGYITSMMNEEYETAVFEEEPLDEIELESRAVDWQHLHNMEMNGQEIPDWAAYMFSRGLSPETLTAMEICHDEVSGRPCITVRDAEGGLAGFKARSIERDPFLKYVVIGDTDKTIATRGPVYGFPPYDASAHVYGLNSAEPIDGTLVLIEGELNVAMARQLGVSNSCGPSGSSFRPRQIEQIVSRCRRVVLLMDSDLGDPGKEVVAEMKLLKAMDQFSEFIDVAVCPHHEGDPMEMTRDELHMLIDGATPAPLYKLLHRFGVDTNAA